VGRGFGATFGFGFGLSFGPGLSLDDAAAGLAAAPPSFMLPGFAVAVFFLSAFGLGSLDTEPGAGGLVPV
jgi:hypothetical protein